jgi:hypothetical protein
MLICLTGGGSTNHIVVITTYDVQILLSSESSVLEWYCMLVGVERLLTSY